MRCKSNTKTGDRCKNIAKNDSKFCSIHRDNFDLDGIAATALGSVLGNILIILGHPSFEHWVFTLLSTAQQQKERLHGGLLPEPGRMARKAVEEGGFSQKSRGLNR
jgi:hypothetical protein